MEFDIGKWLGKIIVEPGNYQALFEFAESEKYLEAHTQGRSVLPSNGTERTVADLDEPIREQVVATISASVKRALDTYSSQMIVLAIALVEGMTQEYVQSIFRKHPSRMHRFLNGGGQSGQVSFKLITESEDKEQILASLARDSSNTLMQGKFDKSLERVESISKDQIPDDLKEELVRLSKVRNQIVHEAHTPSIDKQDVKSAFDRLHELLRWYGAAAVAQSVPIHDPTELVASR
ncbi:hypothetical protein [Marinobacter nitratireducens]|uniref:hypothetical protein n=1 Tax=Marinobacter nitratireducens TaxID=1137280 RepID=UPI00055EF985|nr:hypothetical protein [Marinobacter nitratireducens]